ncbi:MAG TPA: hypothetical protein PK765_00105 [bacterium]|nr:hypothetical protein [bacterium]
MSDRDAMLRIAEAMLAGRSHIEVVDPAFRLALRDRLLANASAHTGAFTSQQIRRRHG